MNEKQLFGLALGLMPPWFIEKIEFDPERKRLDLFLEFERGAKFPCPECTDGSPCPVHDTRERTWRHLDFFQHQAFLTAKVPRIQCPTHGTKQVAVPWARAGSGFTLLFEALALLLAGEMPVSGAAKVLGCHADSVWRILRHYVELAIQKADYSKARKIGVDECSREKGHVYLTTFCDLERSRVVFVSPERSTGVFDAFGAFLEERGFPQGQVTDLCMDMWEPYRMGAERVFPHAAVTFDRYHVMALMNGAIDAVRRIEVEEARELKHSRYLWLKNPENLTERQKAAMAGLSHTHLRTARAYQIKLVLQDLWKHTKRAAAEQHLRRWYYWATHSRIEQVVAVARAIKRHWQGILQFIESRITTGIVEGLNSKIKTAMKRAYGFKSFEYLRIVIYLVAGKLTLPSPTQN